ncbi:MAG: hypothetical protein KDA32_09180 [Phycisphaerales bacterium]|nr:hypothetical protein [Phycisphaerales bacterium]
MRSLATATRCPLCDKPVNLLADYFATSGDFLAPDHPLYPYAGAKMHWDCYEPWPCRPELARPFVEAWIKANRANPYWAEAYRDNQVYVSANPMPPIAEVSLRFYETGNDVRVPLDDWPLWIADKDRRADLREMDRECLSRSLDRIRAALPDIVTIRSLTGRTRVPIRSAAVPTMPTTPRQPRWQV